MLFNRTGDYFGTFNISGEISCYIEKNLANLSRQVGSTCSECYLSLDDIGLRSSDFSRKFKNYKILFT